MLLFNRTVCAVLVSGVNVKQVSANNRDQMSCPTEMTFLVIELIPFLIKSSTTMTLDLCHDLTSLTASC